MFTRRHWNEAVFTEDERNRTTFLELNIYGTSLDERSGSGMTSITPWPLHVHYIRKLNKIPMAVVQRLISSMTRRCVGDSGVNGGYTIY